MSSFPRSGEARAGALAVDVADRVISSPRAPQPPRGGDDHDTWRATAYQDSDSKVIGMDQILAFSVPVLLREHASVGGRIRRSATRSAERPRAATAVVLAKHGCRGGKSLGVGGVADVFRCCMRRSARLPEYGLGVHSTRCHPRPSSS